MGFLVVAFLPSKVSFYTTFFKHCGRGESFGAFTCLRTVAWCRQGHAACKIFLLQQILFVCQSKLMEITGLTLR